MNVDEALRRLGASEEFPREALQWSLDHWDAASNRYLARLRAAAARGKPDEADIDAIFFIVHLFAEKRDPRAYLPVCDMLAADPAVDWLGDTVDDTLASVLISLFDGDAEPLQRVIEAVGANPYARGAALGALSYVVKTGQALGDQALQDYLARLRRDCGPRGQSYFWTAWADTVARMGYATLSAEVARLCSKGWVQGHPDLDLTTIETFHADLAAARSAASATEWSSAFALEPFGSTIETFDPQIPPESEPMRNLPASRFIDGGSAAGTGGAPYVNRNKDVGRNDPCPCGSGKKYKKCCLAA